MNSVFSDQILAEKLSKLNSTQQCIETLSHWCIFHRSKAELVVATWAKQFHSSEMAQKVPLLYLANDILQNSKRKGNEFVTEFWKVLPSALKEVVDEGDERGKNVVSRLVAIWEERKVFGSQNRKLQDTMLGEELPPPLELRKKRSRSVKIVKKDSRSIRTKLSVGGRAEKIVSAFHLVLSEHVTEDQEMDKCKSAIHRVKKMEKGVDVALTKAKDPSRKTFSKELEDDESVLKQCIEKLKSLEASRATLISELRDALNEQESELENLRTHIQVAEAQVEEAASMRSRLEDEDHVFEPKPSTPSTGADTKSEETAKKSAAAIAAEVADKLTASSSSQYIMTSVLSSFAAEEAKNAGLTASSTPSSSILTSENLPSTYMMQVNPSQSGHYQSVSVAVPQTTIANSQAHYLSVPNPNTLQYMQQQQQPSGGMMSSYDYGSLPPPLPPGPPPPPYMMGPMVPMMQQQQQQQQALGSGGSFRPLQAPGMVYYTHPYQ
ncbi:uncharacterized protein LOC127242417 [Andrographis paniculata]|uniref:uncharacterized protein LOC127242417 n=1 Tax=Andrographis paniculata TaxID=175694 RepID=UPI0021E93B89|nr:uncharacterized protein LOC127242417 [Andrographis paniculata]